MSDVLQWSGQSTPQGTILLDFQTSHWMFTSVKIFHNYQGRASNFILYINTKVGFFLCVLFLALTHIEFLRSARLNEGGKFCSELY